MKLPDFKNQENVPALELKSKVLPVGVQLSEEELDVTSDKQGVTLLWNHRWEYDKNPLGFINVLKSFNKSSFKLNICGEKGRYWPNEFDQIKAEFADQLNHYGYVKSRADYIDLLRVSDFMPVTSNQEFFGISVVEGAYYGVIPILPKRLSYLELFSDFPMLFYDQEKEVSKVVQDLVPYQDEIRARLKQFMKQYDWSNIAKSYDHEFGLLIN